MIGDALVQYLVEAEQEYGADVRITGLESATEQGGQERIEPWIPAQHPEAQVLEQSAITRCVQCGLRAR